MKITPLEIRQKSFERNFRGYDKEEVDAFLTTLSQEWERVVEEHKELRYKLDMAEREVSKLREVETSLFKTLKTAEDTGNSMVEQASKKAELNIREAELKAETIINDARARAREIQDKADDKSVKILQAMEKRVKDLEQSYRQLESHRENLLSDLLVLANNTLERVEQAEAKTKKHDLSGLVSAAEQAVRERRFNQDVNARSEDNDASYRTDYQEEIESSEDRVDSRDKKDNSSSFFDTI